MSYHVAQLRNAGVVEVQKHGKSLLLFSRAFQSDRAARSCLAICNSPVSLAILWTIRNAPWISRKELAVALGMDRMTSAWHIRKLLALKLVAEQREKGQGFLFVAREKLPWVEQALSSFAAGSPLPSAPRLRSGGRNRREHHAPILRGVTVWLKSKHYAATDDPDELWALVRAAMEDSGSEFVSIHINKQRAWVEAPDGENKIGLAPADRSAT